MATHQVPPHPSTALSVLCRFGGHPWASSFYRTFRIPVNLHGNLLECGRLALNAEIRLGRINIFKMFYLALWKVLAGSCHLGLCLTLPVNVFYRVCNCLARVLLDSLL